MQPTYAPVPKEGATSLNFINTLPCQVDITFKSETHSFTIAINSTSYHLEEHLDGEEVFYLKAELINPICGYLNITEPTWSGVAEGAGGKVQFNIKSSVNEHYL